MTNNSLFIYVLQLKGGKYFVGSSNSTPSTSLFLLDYEWLRTYPPFLIKHIFENCSVFDEIKYLFEMMDKYGVENVRGECLLDRELMEMELRLLKKLSYGLTGKCVVCGDDEHKIENCEYEIWNRFHQECLICKSPLHLINECPQITSQHLETEFLNDNVSISSLESHQTTELIPENPSWFQSIHSYIVNNFIL